MEWLRGVDGGATWLEALPSVVADVAERWHLDVGAPFPRSHVSFAAPARRDDVDVVLKIQFPHGESAHEADALERWDGDGAVRLLDRDDERSCLLIERCLPGTDLGGEDPDVALEVMIGLLPRLWKPVGEPFTTLSSEAVRWARHLPENWARAGRPFEERLVDEAVRYLDELAPSQGEQVLVHQDLHALNVLASTREPWLAIDPKPLAGEREMSLAPIVRSYTLGHSREAVLHRFDRLTEGLGVDRERARGWTVGQTLAWSLSDGREHQRHVETARWLLDAR